MRPLIPTGIIYFNININNEIKYKKLKSKFDLFISKNKIFNNLEDMNDKFLKFLYYNNIYLYSKTDVLIFLNKIIEFK